MVASSTTPFSWEVSRMSTHSDDGASLLSESTYEILNESALLLTDDEDEGSSVNSFDDDYSVEDINNVEDTDSDSLHEYTPEVHDHPGIPSFGGLDELRMESRDRKSVV